MYEPSWESHSALKFVKEKLVQKPALVFAGETRKLIFEIGLSFHGQSFILHAGECAESFANCRGKYIHEYIKLMSIGSTYLGNRINKNICQIGRIAGQYAKPRSNQTEIINGLQYPSYFGDIINGFELNEREFDPNRMLTAYACSVETLNLIRAFKQGDYSFNKYCHDIFSSKFITDLFTQEIIEELKNNVEIVPQFGDAKRHDFFISHEALLLDYERCFTRIDTTSGLLYNCAAHFVWLGERTRNINSRHVEYLKEIHNPIGIKVGPNFSGDDLLKIISKINPKNTVGKITLITRFGVNFIETELHKLIELVKINGLNITWLCDPMHGNTQIINNIKTRKFDFILTELNLFLNIIMSHGLIPGGIHLEVTPDPVTECIDDELGITADKLVVNYSSKVDPRLNAFQFMRLLKSISL